MIGIIIGVCALVISLAILSYKYYKLNVSYTQIKQDYLNTSSEIIVARNTIDETTQRIKILEKKLDDYEKYSRVMKVEQFVVQPITIQSEIRMDSDDKFLKEIICRRLSEELYSYLKDNDELYRYEVYKNPLICADIVKVQMRLYPYK